MALDSPPIHIPEKKVVRKVLPNGTTFLYSSNPYNQIVALRIYTRMASRHENGEKAGMANLAMRLLPAGTERHTEKQIADKLERNGAHFKSEAGKDWSYIDLLTTSHFLREDLETTIELLECPTFEEKKLARDREIVRMNILEQEDSLMHYTMRFFMKNFFGSHPYAWPSIGLVDTLDNITRDDLIPFALQAFDPPNLVVSVVGGQEEGDTRRIVEDCFAARSIRGTNSLPDSPPASSVIQTNSEMTGHRDSEAEYLVLGYPGVGITDRLSIPVRLISALLGGSMDSRLFREIRDKRGLCYQIGSSFTAYKDLSPLLIYAVTTPPNRAETVTCAEAEIERIKTELVSEEELDRVKTYICGTFAMALETNMGQATRYAIYEISGLGWEYANRFPTEVTHVQPKEIMAAAQQLFTHRLLTITAPTNNKASPGRDCNIIYSRAYIPDVQFFNLFPRFYSKSVKFHPKRADTINC